MPEVKTLTVAINLVKKGDHLVFENRDGFVSSIQQGSKWFAFRDSSDKLIARINREEYPELEVTRTVQTDEEKAAAVNAALEERLADVLHTMLAKVEKTRKALVENLTTGQRMNSHLLEEHAVAQELFFYGNMIKKRMEGHPDGTLKAQFEQAREELTEQLVMEYSPMSSGGFTFNNANQQAQIHAKHQVINVLKWYTI